MLLGLKCTFSQRQFLGEVYSRVRTLGKGRCYRCRSVCLYYSDRLGEPINQCFTAAAAVQQQQIDIKISTFVDLTPPQRALQHRTGQTFPCEVEAGEQES